MSEVTLPDCIEIEPESDAEVSIIWLHGLGADGNDFAPVAQLLASRLSTDIRFILPHAPSIPVTINAGVTMPAWYDMLNMDHPRNVDWDTVAHSEKIISGLIKREEERGVPTSRCILAGFSQGGAMALRMGLIHASSVGGIIALSAYLLQDKEESFSTDNKFPVFMAHGRSDLVIPYSVGETSRDALKSIGCEVEWHDYPMEHNVSEEEISHIQEWLVAKLKIILS